MDLINEWGTRRRPPSVILAEHQLNPASASLAPQDKTGTPRIIDHYTGLLLLLEALPLDAQPWFECCCFFPFFL
jgi:hypothetical protein